MADIITLGDVSTKDAGSGSQLKTGGRRKYSMADKCKKGEVYNTKIKKCISKRESQLRNKLGGRWDTMSKQQQDMYLSKMPKESTKSDTTKKKKRGT
jgi:hypothetical protein